jgi:signal transduction histidine kinase
VALLVLWVAWAVWRYRRGSASPLTDAVPALALLGIGLAVHTAMFVLPALAVTLFYRSMYGSRVEALANGVLYFAVFATVSANVDDAFRLLSLEAAVLLVSLLGTALVMQALGATADTHERNGVWRQALTETSSRLLGASTVEDVHAVTVQGARRLCEDPAATSALWVLREGIMELVATAGGNRLTVDRVALEGSAQRIVKLYLEGRPYLLDAADTHETESVLGEPHRFREVLVAPLRENGRLSGALVLASPTPLGSGLLEIAERFANEVNLALERARLITELERANEELRQADTMKNQFLSMVSHELRTPLTSICGFTETLLGHWEELPDEERRHYVEVVERQGRHQQRLVDDLLITTQLVSGRLRVAPTWVTLKEAVEAAVQEVALPPDTVEVEVDDVRAWADPFHVGQILTNLLSNARKYGRPPIAVRGHTTDETVLVEVVDAGPGVPPAFVPHLFEPFRQALPGDARPSGGAGLGLAIVRQLANLNDGDIAYEPRGQGARFVVTLPAVLRPEAAPGAGERVTPPPIARV